MLRRMWDCLRRCEKSPLCVFLPVPRHYRWEVVAQMAFPQCESRRIFASNMLSSGHCDPNISLFQIPRIGLHISFCGADFRGHIGIPWCLSRACPNPVACKPKFGNKLYVLGSTSAWFMFRWNSWRMNWNPGTPHNVFTNAWN